MIRVVTLDCRRGERVRAEANTSGYPGWIQEGPTSCKSRAPLRVGGGKDRPLPRPGEAVPWSHGSLDGLQAARRCPGPRRKRAESCRDAQIGPRFPLRQLRLAMAIPRWSRARRSSPSLPYPPGCAARAPGARRRPAGTVPSPYSRRLSGGCHSAVTCPSPRQGSADQLITTARRAHHEGHAPPVVCARRDSAPL